MVKIRLKRLGRKKRPFYRVVVTDLRNRRDGEPLAELGYYNPLSKELKLNKTEALSWVSKGAHPSDTVKRLIDAAPESGELIKLEIARKERLSKKARAKQETEAKAKAEAAAAPPAAEEAPAEAPAEEAKAEEAGEAEEEPKEAEPAAEG